MPLQAAGDRPKNLHLTSRRRKVAEEMDNEGGGGRGGGERGERGEASSETSKYPRRQKRRRRGEGREGEERGGEDFKESAQSQANRPSMTTISGRRRRPCLYLKVAFLLFFFYRPLKWVMEPKKAGEDDFAEEATRQGIFEDS